MLKFVIALLFFALAFYMAYRFIKKDSTEQKESEEKSLLSEMFSNPLFQVVISMMGIIFVLVGMFVIVKRIPILMKIVVIAVAFASIYLLVKVINKSLKRN